MEDLLANAFNTGDIKIVVVAAILYLVINAQRKSTKTERDNANESLKTEIALLKNEIERIKALDLETKLAQILTDLNWLKQKFMEK